MPMLLIALVAALLTGGCMSGIIKELAKDKASACITIVSIYGTIRIARTGAANAAVSCTDTGLAIRAIPSPPHL